MTKLTKKEREIVLKAMGMVEDGSQYYTCYALRDANASISLINKYEKFFDCSDLNFNHHVGAVAIYRINKGNDLMMIKHRLMLLATFAVLG